MKKIIILMLLVTLTSASIAQIVNIPDANFKNELVNSWCADLDGDGEIDGDVDTNDDGEIQETEAAAVYLLDIRGKSISSLEGIASFTILEVLDCGKNHITSLDFSQNLNLVHLEAGPNFLTSIDVSQNINLTYLDCRVNFLTSVDISANLNLETLLIFDNQLTEIDLTQNPVLEWVVVVQNQLSTLDLSQNPELLYLNFSYNLMESIDVSHNQNLVTLGGDYNQLSEIDVSQNPDLYLLSVNGNELSSLDMSFNPLLWSLSCSFNQILVLDLSMHAMLEFFTATNNNLLYLNLRNGNNLNLERMWVDDNSNLDCIVVDDVVYANAQICNFPEDSWCKDAIAFYNEECVLGIDDIENKLFSMYPNPTKGIFSISSSEEVVALNVYNIAGQLVAANTFADSLDISNLSSGLYLVHIEGENDKVVTKKLIKK